MKEEYDHTRFHLDTLVLDRVKYTAYACEIYEAPRVEIVLGRSAKAEKELYLENCLADGVPINRRSGGGGTVVLSPGVIILSIAGRSVLPYHLREHMLGVNNGIIEVLHDLGVRSLSHEGISDIALKEKKILGSSLYRSGDLVLYQGSLLLNPDLGLMDRYLKQPEKQPEYRRGRPHGGFVTSLHLEGYGISAAELVTHLRKRFEDTAPWPPLPHPGGS
jgi:lipoate-protein ligase A